ncbi:hypothetical protein BX616_005079 [Lobosporangium transversale]|uniref:F-box domain-containing protein n=1 Tax=Lobosporangium transversale TaxID=64571 RepID=A0A1Y2GT01_9FUNG|nr:hypothetical protein BCR41DRAFT_369420 [Lobosporangium transversale]KAF9897729.1 hypothetical protein BX616_005079 [Lobosporangium transversale]ORZ21951.1 hypothetical protein BCR41DRAFT_369420 [Lobosporangium transversale]|eukprot:XP_021883202.1 hypothetical protein BCR41DRAFT_369420 [Lobosporangium transversale]
MVNTSTVTEGARTGDNTTTVLEGQLIDLSLDEHDTNAAPRHVSDSGSFEDEEDIADNISLGSIDTDSGPNTLPPTYDLASILGTHAAASNNNGTTTSTTTSTTTTAVTTGINGNATVTNSRIPVNIPSTAEMENLPIDVVALILETLTILELFDLHKLSDRWRQLTTRALLDKFMMSHVVLWIDQEGHRTFRPEFLFDSFDEATNRIRWLPKPTHKPELRGQVYSKTFGITKPMIRIISVGDVDKYDYLDKEAHMTIVKPGTRTLLGSDKGCPWAFIYKVSSFTRKGKKIDGERWIEPISFECHLDFLNPRRAHKLRLLWYLQKSYATMPIVGDSARKQINRSKVEGALPAQQMSEFFSGRSQPLSGSTLSTFR